MALNNADLNLLDAIYRSIYTLKQYGGHPEVICIRPEYAPLLDRLRAERATAEPPTVLYGCRVRIAPELSKEIAFSIGEEYEELRAPSGKYLYPAGKIKKEAKGQ